jgi:hypothetical protein
MFEEAGRDHGPFRVILNGNNRSFGTKRTVSALDQNAIGKFERVRDHKQHLARRAELDDGLLQRTPGIPLGPGIAMAIGRATGAVRFVGAAEPDWNAHRRRVRKKPGEPADIVGRKSTSGGTCLVGHGDTSIPEREQPGLPLFLVWKSCRQTQLCFITIS